MADFAVKDGQKIVFMGDSITDGGRLETPGGLGWGYVSLFTQLATARHPERRITFVNRGISGQNIVDLKQRWDDDVLRKKPDWLTLMIGINDIHQFLGEPTRAVSPEMYRDTYEFVIQRTMDRLDIPVVLLQPFYISRKQPAGTFEARVLKVLPQYIKVVEDMAKKYKTRLVLLHEVFQKHLRYREPKFFCDEPVHPNLSGHMVIAEELLRAFES
jgi:lysophospholipase L1-like esterase